jgi:hypothetical protein
MLTKIDFRRIPQAFELQALDGMASDEEIRILEDELRRPGDGRRRAYVALARLRGTLDEVWRTVAVEGRAHAS